MLTAFFFAILVPPSYLSLHVLRRKEIRLSGRILVAAFLFLVSQIYTIDSALFRNLSGPDMPAWLLVVQVWLFTAQILLFLCVFCRDVFRLLRLCARRLAPRRETPFAPSRRAFLRGGAASLAATLGAPALCLGVSAAGVSKGTALPLARSMEAFLPHLPDELEGFRLAHLTDVHVGPLTSIDWVRQVVELVNAARPDIICLSGDLADGRWEYRVARGGNRSEAAAQFAGFRAREGVFACTGNHEYYSDYAGWMELYENVGIRMLHNEGVVIGRGGASLAVAGLDDMVAAGFGKSLPGCADVLSSLPDRKENAVRIVLDHRPARAVENAAAGADMQLSGHTHGGQCLGMDRIVARANQGFLRGWYDVSGMALHVSSGAGLWSGFPVRLGVPAEIAVITLRKGRGDRPLTRDVVQP